MRILKAALQQQNYNLAAHVLVYGLVKAKKESNANGKKRTPNRQSKRS